MLKGGAAAAGIGDPASPHYPRAFNPTPPWPHGFPIEGAPPDIARWRAGNTGIPYLWTFDGPAPGPHAAVVALTHGEEWSGAHAVDMLLREGVRPARGRLSLLFHNWRAHARWNPAEPNRAFYIDRDLNRVWDPALLDGDAQGGELDRARELRGWLDTVDHLLDLHSTQQPCPPFALAGRLSRSVAFAQDVGFPHIVIEDMPHAAGLRMRDWPPFEDPAGHRTALVVECGQHWVASSVTHARQAALAFLTHLGMAPAPLLAACPPPRGAVQVIETTGSVTATTDACELLATWPDLALVPRAGTLIGQDGPAEVRTPHDDAVLILPVRRPRRGLTAVRFGRVRVGGAAGLPLAHAPG
ncbi:peptidase M14 [Falsiroseomonas sp. HW251]|uniref:peptidase M14 n=1 Tax=Falsiroseomonas sp. HW251 TaxID=3390998 RepID=UPI003D310380